MPRYEFVLADGRREPARLNNGAAKPTPFSDCYIDRLAGGGKVRSNRSAMKAATNVYITWGWKQPFKYANAQ